MHINKEKIDELLKEFISLENKNSIDEKNLTMFNQQKKEDLVYLSFINSKDQHYITFLNFLVKKTHPLTIVELGNREGLSTLALYDAAKKVDADFYSIDIEKDLRYCPQHMFNDPKMHFLFGDVCSLKIVQELPKKIDILFTDTLHFDFQVRDEWEIYQHLLSDKALVAIDDININDKRKLFDEVPFSKWDLTELCHANGWGLFLFERKSPLEEAVQATNIYKSTIQVWERKYESLYKNFEQVENKGLVKKVKNTLKKVTPLYVIYTVVFNKINFYYNQKINKNRRMVYGESVRF